jgi:hypothetical protein
MRNSHIEGRKNVYIHKILPAFLVPDKNQRQNHIHRPSLLEKILYNIQKRSSFLHGPTQSMDSLKRI